MASRLQDLTGTPMRFRDRADAGRQLAARLAAYADRPDVLVLALPRGGVPVAFEVATALHLPLDVFLVRKLGVPGHPELAMGAIAAGGVRVLSEDLISELDIPRSLVEQVSVRERFELERRDRVFRGDRPFPALRNRTIIVIDDGLATGATVEAAVAALRVYEPARIVVAAPVGAAATRARLTVIADAVICLRMPEPFTSVGSWYDRFEQTSDDEVVALLSSSRPRSFGSGSSSEEHSMSTREIPREQWRQELDSFSRQHEGWIVRVRVTDPDGHTQTEARDLPLQGVSADSPRTDGVAIIVGRAPDDHVTHEVPNPVTIAIEQSDSGAERALRIRAGDGSTTTVEFRSAARAEDVDHVGPR